MLNWPNVYNVNVAIKKAAPAFNADEPEQHQRVHDRSTGCLAIQRPDPRREAVPCFIGFRLLFSKRAN
jgi:hypothetical protein